MSSNNKHKKLNDAEEQPMESESDSESSEDDEMYNANEVSSLLLIRRFRQIQFEMFSQEIQVEFEGRNPISRDFHGIRQLLQQLFLKSDINLSELSDIITG